jgi:hypothetical protein
MAVAIIVFVVQNAILQRRENEVSNQGPPACTMQAKNVVIFGPFLPLPFDNQSKRVELRCNK